MEELLGRDRSTWKDNVRMDLKERGCKEAVAQDGIQRL
jgi:hypothetical protein